MRPRNRLLILLPLSLLVSLSFVVARSRDAFPDYVVGYEFNDRLAAVTDASPLPVPDPTASKESPLAWRLEVFWAEIERERGKYDWSTVETLVDRFREAGHEPILCLWGGNPLYAQEILAPPTAADPAYVEAWEGFVRSAARRFRKQVRFFEIWRNPNVPGLWPGKTAARQYAFLLKRSSAVIRGEAGGDTAVISGGLYGADTAFLGKLFDEGVATYLDVVALRPDPGAPVGEQVGRIASLLERVSPSTRVWAMGVEISAERAEAAIEEITDKALSAFAAGARVVIFDLPPGERGWPDRADALARLHSVFQPGLGLLPQTRAAFEDEQGAALGDMRSLTFYDVDKGLAVVAYRGTAGLAAGRSARVRLDARRPGPPIFYDPVSGEQTEPPFEAVSEGAVGDVPVLPGFRFLLFREGVGMPRDETVEQEAESLRVVAERGMTAEEVITKHQAVSAAQRGRLQNYRAKGLVEFHFRLSGYAARVDIGMGGNFFYDNASGPEWEFTEYFVNGNRSPWKEFPELPLIQPEKVVTLPLDITFDRSYRYGLVGEDRVEGRNCWVLSFDPVDPEKSLYRGKVWIDKETFNKIRTSAVQTRLETPFLSNEERNTYGPVDGADGEIWLLKRIDGQQIYTTAGRNFIVNREVTFEGFVVNGPAFEEERRAAYSSDHQMMRETDKGFRYLVKDETGERVVKNEIDKNQLFGLAGVFYDDSRDFPLPLAGINYFDYDFRGTGIQTNVFFAGLLVNANATKPEVFGTKYEIGADLFGLAIDGTDKAFDRGREVEERDVDLKSQSLSFNLGHPLGQFAKIRTSVGLRRVSYSRSDDTIENFDVPADNWEREVELTGTYDRSGYSVNASAAIVSRSDWPSWGCRARGSGPRDPKARCGLREPLETPEWSPDAQVFQKWSLSASKEWFLPYFQKVRAELSYLDGTDLDRFSRYQFSFFGTRLRGFSGTGVRFDEGVVARGTYAFNLADVIRFGAHLDHGRVRDLSARQGFGNHTGIGISGSFLGPWQTILQFDTGYALRSDIDDAEGSAELLLVVLKLF